MQELENIKRALRNGVIPNKKDIEHILKYQKYISIQEKEEFYKMFPIISQMTSFEQTEKKALISKKENIFLKIPIIRRIYEKIKSKNVKKSKIIGAGTKDKEPETIKGDGEKLFRKELGRKLQSKKETIVISDLHGNIERWEIVRKQLIVNPNLKVIILGDAMDKGPFGVEILLEIKELSEQGRVQYLPGNHDEFAYNYIKARNINEEIYNRNKKGLECNGGKSTMEKLNNFDNIVLEQMKRGRLHKQITLDQLMNWLGRQPIQIAARENDVNYALSHAIFDTHLYKFNQRFCLEDALNIELSGNNNEMLNRFKNCLWYREKDKRFHFAPVAWPKDYIVIVGHTMQQSVNMENIENDNRKPIIYVDCGKGSLQGFNLTTGNHEQIGPEPNRETFTNNNIITK